MNMPKAYSDRMNDIKMSFVAVFFSPSCKTKTLQNITVMNIE